MRDESGQWCVSKFAASSKEWQCKSVIESVEENKIMGVEGVLTLNSFNKKYCKQQLSKTLTTKEKC